MVPVLAVPVLNRPDLLAACLGSIDIPVRLVVIDNSGTGELADVALDVRPDAIVVEPPTNTGYTRAVNDIIRAFPHDPYWLVSNADVVFGPGDLQRLCDGAAGWLGVNGDWRVFKLTADTVARVGLWDENFFNYCSDADYERRCDLAGVTREFIEGTTTHIRSVVIAEARYGADNRHSYPAEVAYYASKWGVPVRASGGFTTPFDEGGHVGDWRYDLSIVRQTHWR